MLRLTVGTLQITNKWLFPRPVMAKVRECLCNFIIFGDANSLLCCIGSSNINNLLSSELLSSSFMVRIVRPPVSEGFTMLHYKKNAHTFLWLRLSNWKKVWRMHCKKSYPIVVVRFLTPLLLFHFSKRPSSFGSIMTENWPRLSSVR